MRHGLGVTNPATRSRVSSVSPTATKVLIVEQSWLGNRAISDKTADGFTVTFDKPAPSGATLDWMLVR